MNTVRLPCQRYNFSFMCIEVHTVFHYTTDDQLAELYNFQQTLCLKHFLGTQQIKFGIVNFNRKISVESIR